MENKKNKKNIKNSFLRLLQTAYLTIRFYIQNNLDACASACSFGFIFSFIPILMMILTILVKIFHTSHEIMQLISDFTQQVGSVFDVQNFISKIAVGITFNRVNAILAVFTIWMARKLFLSIIQGLTQIFKTKAPSAPLMNQVLTFAGELIVVILTVFVFFASFTTRQIFSLPVFKELQTLSPILFGSLSNLLLNFVLYVILFIFAVLAYKFGSRTKPPLKLCIWNALLCTLLFYGVTVFIFFFFDKVNYNTVYGVLSNFIIMLFQVYIYFSLFMFFGQAIYISQYFESLLLSEIYLLPKHNTTSIKDSVRRILFITPKALMNKHNTKKYSVGETIYSASDKTDGVYYVASGTVLEDRETEKLYHDTGTFFGESEFLLNINRRAVTVAQNDCIILHICEKDFSELMDKDSNAVNKAMSKLSRYSSKFYRFMD